MAYKETNPGGLGIGSGSGGTTLPKIDCFMREGKIVAIEDFTDNALESIGKAITRRLILDAREARNAKK